MSRGAANAQALTAPFGDQVSPDVFESFGSEYDSMNTEAHPATGGSAVSFLLILIGLIVAMWFVHKSSSVLARDTFGVNWMSFFQVGIMASAFILLSKAVFGRWHVRGVTPAVSAI
jgi:hypothetical protein